MLIIDNSWFMIIDDIDICKTMVLLVWVIDNKELCYSILFNIRNCW